MNPDELLAELNGEAGDEAQEQRLWEIMEVTINLAFDSLRIMSASSNLVCISTPQRHFIYNTR